MALSRTASNSVVSSGGMVGEGELSVGDMEDRVGTSVSVLEFSADGDREECAVGDKDGNEGGFDEAVVGALVVLEARRVDKMISEDG